MHKYDEERIFAKSHENGMNDRVSQVMLMERCV
ncbi:hypothetical protein HCH_05495 [Hahella chejuensis KCTC 2396]|uniref:Uncharacterized protein n=1 Tax=Hahella chejuensis (strain KCTC 2396) TaxID=349521 RepID=Q2SB16_HAHCH|nr:hypothetical protein HCH_05495 [Hahella chejuensis KCTC 2396]